MSWEALPAPPARSYAARLQLATNALVATSGLWDGRGRSNLEPAVAVQDGPCNESLGCGFGLQDVGTKRAVAESTALLGLAAAARGYLESLFSSNQQVSVPGCDDGQQRAVGYAATWLAGMGQLVSSPYHVVRQLLLG